MPEVPAGVPLVKDYVSNDEDKAALDVIFTSTILARPTIAPPGIPPDRAKALRDTVAELNNLARQRDFTSDRLAKFLGEKIGVPIFAGHIDNRGVLHSTVVSAARDA